MAHSKMLPAVIQAVILCGLSSIVSHHLVNNAFTNAGESELWLNITTAMARIENATTTGLNNTTISNTTTTPALNLTAEHLPSNSTQINPPGGESYYGQTLPRSMFILAMIAPLYYYWQLWLERILPRRARAEARLPPPEKADFGDDGDREQEVIEKWIAQGKIRRSSLSWWNTFLKWALHCTLGALWVEAMRYLLETVLYWRWPLTIWKKLSYWVSYRRGPIHRSRMLTSITRRFSFASRAHSSVLAHSRH